MPEFNDWYPTSLHGDNALNVKSFGAFGDGAAHSMSDLGYADLAAAQVDYPSATTMSDTADWCAITECLKQAYTTGGVPNGTDASLNKPVCFPTGRYLIRKRITVSVDRSIIYGTGYVQIYCETPDEICFYITGMQNCRIDNLDFQSAGGPNSIAMDMNVVTGEGVVNSTGNLITNCHFASPEGVACYIGRDGIMGSEMTFIRCNFSLAACGVVIGNWNALNYNFMACTGTGCTLNWIRVNTGGNIVIQNASLADNGTDTVDASAADIYVGAGTAVIMGSRTESKKFVISNGKTTLLACAQANEGNDLVFCENGAQLFGCESVMGRLAGSGNFTMDGCSWSLATIAITNIAVGTAGVVKITHTPHPNVGREQWLEGDQVKIVNVVSANTTPAGGAAHTNGIWIISKLNATQFELVGSTFVADTYTYTDARIMPGPYYHMQKLNLAFSPPLLERDPQETVVVDRELKWIDSGMCFDNLGATGAIQFTLPPMNTASWYEVRGTKYTFTVLEAQTITIRAYPGSTPATRIFRAGGYATAGANISSNVVGNTVEIYQVDGKGSSAEEGFIGHRWLVRSETGTWTIAGTPA